MQGIRRAYGMRMACLLRYLSRLESWALQGSPEPGESKTDTDTRPEEGGRMQMVEVSPMGTRHHTYQLPNGASTRRPIEQTRIRTAYILQLYCIIITNLSNAGNLSSMDMCRTRGKSKARIGETLLTGLVDQSDYVP